MRVDYQPGKTNVVADMLSRPLEDIKNGVENCTNCQRYKESNLKPMGLYQTVSSKQRFRVQDIHPYFSREIFVHEITPCLATITDAFKDSKDCENSSKILTKPTETHNE
ncbi:unnamed protein product, partial [Ceratitis capitata]